MTEATYLSQMPLECVTDALSLPQARTLLRARLFVVTHTSLEVGARESLWLLSQQQDPACLERWRHAWRISLDDILSHVDYHKEFSKLR